MQWTGFQRRIQEEYQARKTSNKRYSVRAFSKLLGIDHGSLAQIMRGTRRPTAAQTIAWCDRLRLTNAEKRAYLSLATSGDLKLLDQMVEQSHNAVEIISLVREPIHFELLSMARKKLDRIDLRELAQQLETTTDALQIAISRLLRFGWIEMSGAGILRDRTGLPELTRQSYSRLVDDYANSNCGHAIT